MERRSPFDESSRKDVLGLVLFLLQNGVRLGKDEYSWKLIDGKFVETPEGIRFGLKGVGMLAETFLSQIHFAGLDLRGKTVVTAGAYIGDTPLYFSHYGAKVYAFEPSPVSFKIAEENLSLNPSLRDRVTLRNWAIGLDGEVDFPLEEDSGGTSIFERTNSTVKVRSVSISTILKEFDLKDPYLLDLDVKGAEYYVVNDLGISNFEVLRIEYSPYLVEGATLDHLISKVREKGFKKVRVFKHNCLKFDLRDHGTLHAEK
ncbi:FkbM family methyltransferase [Sulfodiicoccus acidiphilus]|nr:FkbM family methyltransferase [Sulfodiicoccus acidiphilus]